MLHRLAPYNRLVVCALISTYLSPADSSFRTRISPLTWLCPSGIVCVPLLTGWNMCIGQATLFCAGYPPSWQWIGENLQEALGFPDKGNVRASPGSGWTAAELNHILQAHVVDGTLTTFGCVEWESEQFRGVMRARCYPFKMPKRRFHGVNPQVYMVVYPIIYSTYKHIPVRTSMY